MHLLNVVYNFTVANTYYDKRYEETKAQAKYEIIYGIINYSYFLWGVTHIVTWSRNSFDENQFVYLGKETSNKYYQDEQFGPFLSTKSGSLKWMSDSDVPIHSETDDEPAGYEIDNISQIITKFTSKFIMIVQKPGRILCYVSLLSYNFRDISSIDCLYY